MLQLLIVSLLLALQTTPTTKTIERVITYRGDDYRTTTAIAPRFIGRYSGNKTGFLELKKDGTGTYKYDIFGFAPASCKRKAINIEWGFLLDSLNKVVKKKRDYGYSYPILLKSISSTSFQGCRTPVMMDYILDKNGVLMVSSSDDWKKK